MFIDWYLWTLQLTRYSILPKPKATSKYTPSPPPKNDPKGNTKIRFSPAQVKLVPKVFGLGAIVGSSHTEPEEVRLEPKRVLCVRLRHTHQVLSPYATHLEQNVFQIMDSQSCRLLTNIETTHRYSHLFILEVDLIIQESTYVCLYQTLMKNPFQNPVDQRSPRSWWIAQPVSLISLDLLQQQRFLL